MRRSTHTLVFVLLSLSIFPARADAYFWAWLDELSGPKSWGAAVEWKVYCRSKLVVDRRKALKQGRHELQRLSNEYSAASKVPGLGQPFHVKAAAYARVALWYLDGATNELERNPRLDVEKVLQQVKAYTLAAYAHGLWGDRLRAGETLDDAQAPTELTIPREPVEVLDFGAGVGVSFSLCEAEPDRKDTQFLSINVGYAWDMKDENRAFKHRLVTVGASYHLIVSPSVTLGAGAGVATFSSTTRNSFSKVYLQPMMVDIRPWQFFTKYQESSPWYHVVYLRGSLTTFPTGFEPGSFGSQTERYHAELVRAVGVHFDFAPVLLDLQGKWLRAPKQGGTVTKR